MSEGKPRELFVEKKIIGKDDFGKWRAAYVNKVAPAIAEKCDIYIEKSAYTKAIEALKRINEDFGTDYADGNVMIANQVLRELGELGE